MNYAKKTFVYFVVHTAICIIALLFALFSNFSVGYREGAISGIAGGFIFTGIISASI